MSDRIASADPSDDLTTDQIIKQRIEAERSSRSLSTTKYGKTAASRTIAVLDSRVGAPPKLRKQSGAVSNNNITAFEYNHYVRERYAPLYPIRGVNDLRSYAMSNTTGRTAIESSNRKKRGNKRVVRKRAKKKT
tara:strand:- start:1245 stop:1646 length:402 start_codon:yes stop_codon:yes gene_type:complete